MTNIKPVGRKRKYAEYEALLASLSGTVTKRPKYIRGIGIMSGARHMTAWLKIRLTHGGMFKGHLYASGAYVEIKLGLLASFNWEQLEAEYRLLQGKADRNEPLEPAKDVTFADYTIQYLQYSKGRIENPQNLRNLDRDIKNRLLPYFGKMPLKAIKASDINLWQAKQREQLTISSIKRNKNNLCAILNSALKDELIERNPCTFSDKLRVPETNPRFIRKEELQALILRAPEVNDWLQSYLYWCLLSGMRQGEIRNLVWGNVFWPEQGLPYINILTGKTKRVRRVTCSPRMASILREHSIIGQNPQSPVFPYPAISIKRAWNRLRNITKLYDVTLHNFRTSNATHAAHSRVDSKTLASRLGHSDLSMMSKYYVGIEESSEEQAAIAIGNTFEEMLKLQN